MSSSWRRRSSGTRSDFLSSGLTLVMAASLVIAACGGSEPVSRSAPTPTTVGTGAAATAAGTRAPATAAPLEPQVVFAGPGGIYETTFKQQVFPAFEQATGVKVQYVSGGADVNFAKIKAEASSPTIDFFWATTSQVITGTNLDLLQPIDTSRLKNLGRMQKTYRPEGKPNGITLGVLTLGLFYNTKIVAEKGLKPPSSWKDLWDPKYKGMVEVSTLPSAVTHAFVVQIAKLNGGDENNVKPAMDEFRKLRPNLFASPPSATALDGLIQQGNAAVGYYHAARVQQLATSGVPIKYVLATDGVPVLEQTGSIVKNAPHPNAAYALFDFMLSEKVQLLLTPVLGYLPVVDGIPQRPQDADYVPGPNAKLTLFDWKAIEKNAPLWLDQWQSAMK